MPNENQLVDSCKALKAVGVDDVWIIPNNIYTAMSGIQTARYFFGARAGVLGMPKELPIEKLMEIATQSNALHCWSGESQRDPRWNTRSTDYFNGIILSHNIDTLFTSYQEYRGGSAIRCVGDPFSLERKSWPSIPVPIGHLSLALCGHVMPEDVQRYGDKFKYYVLSPFLGKDPEKWSVCADIETAKAVCKAVGDL